MVWDDPVRLLFLALSKFICNFFHFQFVILSVTLCKFSGRFIGRICKSNVGGSE
jgi:hypothetical protein